MFNDNRISIIGVEADTVDEAVITILEGVILPPTILVPHINPLLLCVKFVKNLVTLLESATIALMPNIKTLRLIKINRHSLHLTIA